MQHLFMDESGTLGFGTGGTKYFVLALVAPSQGRKLAKAIKNINAHLIRNGWPPEVEIKATNVWYSPKHPEIPAAYRYKDTPEIPMQHIMESIGAVDGYIEYVVIKLDTVDEGLRTAPYGILYNYFSWQLFKGALCYFPEVELYVDKRNRETHEFLKFDGYIESKAGIARAEKRRPPINLRILHYHDQSVTECPQEQRTQVEFGVRGLQAADFVCWAIKCKFENGRDRWYSILEPRIRWRQCLYFEDKK